jgi:hypothetical protein
METELAPSGDTFTTRAVEMQTHNGAIAPRDWTTEEWTKQGAMHPGCRAAVRFAEGLTAGVILIQRDGIDFNSERFIRLLVEGETNVDTIIGENFDEASW